MLLCDRINDFNTDLQFEGSLPKGIRIMNPYQENAEAYNISALFYRKYYSDNNKRKLILGINPGRFGAGLTGIPFTDTYRLEQYCDITFNGQSYEPSSVFVYDVIETFGGANRFFAEYYINSVCPLGFVITDKKGRHKNYNYYDSRELYDAMYEYIVNKMERQIDLGMYTDTVYCLGTGKNYKTLLELNDRYGWFHDIVPLEHPRYVMQYKYKKRADYVDKYLRAFLKA